MSGAGMWDRLYAGFDYAAPFGGTESYEIGAEWLESCSLVEDWGCGKGWLRTLIEPERYRGLDGSATPVADEVVDLAEHRSQTPGLFMRHLLEHNDCWATILDNAVASFTERMALILYTPLAAETREIGREADPDVPVISFALKDITSRFDCAFKVRYLHHEDRAAETIVCAKR